jgi:hypothetical protein
MAIPDVAVTSAEIVEAAVGASEPAARDAQLKVGWAVQAAATRVVVSGDMSTLTRSPGLDHHVEVGVSIQLARRWQPALLDAALIASDSGV